MNIAKNSPHLDGVLKRLLKKQAISSKDYSTIDRAFVLSMQNAGKKELDFLREEGVSFNPRPARIALILIKDAKETCGRTIAASILASVVQELGTKDFLGFEEGLIKILREARKAPEKIDNRQAALIACSIWLDRARHFHQATEEKKQQLLETFLEQTDGYISLAKKHSDNLLLMLQAWKSGTTNRAKKV